MNFRQTYRNNLNSIKKKYNNLFVLIVEHNIVYIDNLCINPCVLTCQRLVIGIYPNIYFVIIFIYILLVKKIYLCKWSEKQSRKPIL